MVYRNHLVYYLLMPGIWLSAILVYWGFGAVYGVYVVLKMSVIIGAHSSVPWDAPLYERFPRLMWVVERVISTPATHSAHHGLSADDGITHYKGNFGNLLFVGRAVRPNTRNRPTEFGIEHLEPVRASRRCGCARVRTAIQAQPTRLRSLEPSPSQGEVGVPSRKPVGAVGRVSKVRVRLWQVHLHDFARRLVFAAEEVFVVGEDHMTGLNQVQYRVA